MNFVAIPAEGPVIISVGGYITIDQQQEFRIEPCIEGGLPPRPRPRPNPNPISVPAGLRPNKNHYRQEEDEGGCIEDVSEGGQPGRPKPKPRYQESHAGQYEETEPNPEYGGITNINSNSESEPLVTDSIRKLITQYVNGFS